jgi:hypothetical protein
MDKSAWAGPSGLAAKQLKSGDVVLHTATTAEADTLKDTEEEWVKVLGTSARVVRPTYGVIVHGVRTSKESIDIDNQQRAIEKIESENAVLHEGAKVTYVDWLTREGRKKQASSLVVEFTTKYHANRHPGGTGVERDSPRLRPIRQVVPTQAVL